MSTRKLIVLGVILAVIAVVAGVSKLMGPDERSITEETGYVDLAQKGFLVSDVAWFEVWRQGKEGDKITINRAGEAWTVGSRFGAPADKEKVDGCIIDYPFNCRLCSVIFGLKKPLAEMGIPTLVMEADEYDTRQHSAASMRTRVEAFAELLKAKKAALVG